MKKLLFINILLLVILAFGTANAQVIFTDSFEDGSITTNPVWTGGGAIPATSIADFLDNNTSPVLAGTESLRSNTGIIAPVGTIPSIYNQYISSGNLSTSNMVWRLLYRNNSTSDAGTGNYPASGAASWRFWLAADGSSNTSANGYALIHKGNTLVLNRYTAGTTVASTIATYTFPSTPYGYTYSIKITRRASDGYWQMYVNQGTAEATTLAQANYDANALASGSNAIYTMLEANDNSTTNNRFVWDNIQISSAQLQVACNSNTVNTSTMTPGGSYAIMSFQLTAIEDVPLKFIYIGQNSNANSKGAFASIKIIQSTDNSYTTTGDNVDITSSFSNEYITDSYLEYYNNSGVTIANGTSYYYFIVATLSTSYATDPNALTSSISSSTTYNGTVGSFVITANNAVSQTAYSCTAPTAAAFGSYFDWTGSSSTTFGTAGNWNGSAVPGVNDVARFAVNTSVSYSNQPTISSSITIGQLIIGTKNSSGGSMPVLTVNAPLTVNGAITQNSNWSGTGNSSSFDVSEITGSSTITATAFNVGDGSSPSLPNGENAGLEVDMASTGSITVSGDMTINGVVNSGGGIGPAAIIMANGTFSCNRIVTNNVSGATSYFYLDAAYLGLAGTGTLQLNGATPFVLSSTGTSYFDLGGGSANPSTNVTVNYAATANQSVFINLPQGAGTAYYDNVTFSGSGTKSVASTGTLKTDGNLTTSGTATVDLTVNNPTVTLAGTLVNGSGCTFKQGTGTLTVAGALTNNGSLTLSTGTAAFNGTFANTGTFDGGSSSSDFNGTFTNTGATTFEGGSSTISATFNNNSPGTFSATAGTISFDQTANQTISSTTTSSPVSFYNLTIANSSGTAYTKTLSGAGSFSVASNGVLTVSGKTTLAAGTALLTLNSDVNGAANVAALATGASITGTVNVQRFVTGGAVASYRGYRNMSSPVSSTGTTGGLVDLTYIPASTIVTGATCTGCTVAGNPSLYLYNESLPVSNSNFVSGNFVGVTKINTTTLSTLSGTTTTTTSSLPAGNGFYLFFRGNNTTTTGKTTQVSGAFANPENVTFTATGTLNQGQIIVKDWFNQSSSNLSYTTATGTTARGFNLVGNPYASSIDWHTAYSGTATNGIYAPNTDQTVYIYNTTTKNYSTYLNTSSSTGTAAGSAGGSNIIPSGQGFYVRATGTGAQLIFNETAKVSSQPTTLLLNSAPAGLATADKHLRLQLYKDSINIDESVIIFNQSASPKFVSGEDCLYLKGSGVVSLSNNSSDNYALAINQTPFMTGSQTIPLNAYVTASGNYKLNLTEVANIPNLYDVWLMDAYQKDSLDFKHNPTYTFNANLSDTTTFGSKRFSLVIRENTAYAFHLLSFNGAKATGGAQLNWTTENEDSFTTFNLQRSTDHGRTFTTITTLLSNGSGAYNYLDSSPGPAQNQYRLQVQAIDGGVTYSSVVIIDYGAAINASASNISVYPNPAKDILNLDVTAANNASATYTINMMNSNGSLIKTVPSAQASSTSQVGNLTPGVYIIRVINNADNSIAGTTKFIKL